MSEEQPDALQREKRRTICCLVPPTGDKSWTFQILTDDPDLRGWILGSFKTIFLKDTAPFLQADTSTGEGFFLMVEFWTKDEILVRRAAAFLTGLCLSLELIEGMWAREVLEREGWL